MVEPTDADRQRAIEVYGFEHSGWCDVRPSGVDCFCAVRPRIAAIAAAIAEERERARAPFVALAEELRREASFGDGTQRAYELDEVADRIRAALDGGER